MFSRSTARKYEIERKHEQRAEQNKEAHKPVRELEEARRNEALSTSTLTETNRGFNLMLKMGFEKGKGLGRPANDADSVEPTAKKAHLEPIPIVLKSDRVGLGHSSEQQQRLDEARRLRQQTEQNAQTSYVDKKRSNFLFRKLLHSLHKCQRVCFQLDSSTHVICISVYILIFRIVYSLKFTFITTKRNFLFKLSHILLNFLFIFCLFV